MKQFPISIIEALILLFTAWNARSLIDAWDGTLYIQFARVAFMISLVPLMVFFVFRKSDERTNVPFLFFAIIASTVGMLGSMNAFKYLGFALALSGLTPLSMWNFLWFVSMASWMPAFGYFLSVLEPHTVMFLRLLISAIGALSSCFGMWYRKETL